MAAPPGAPAAPELDPARRLVSRGAAAAAAIALLGGSALLAMQSCAQTSASRPIQAEPKPDQAPDASTDPSPEQPPRPEEFVAPPT